VFARQKENVMTDREHKVELASSQILYSTPKTPRRGTFAHYLAAADASNTPLTANELKPYLQRLAKLCKVLADDARNLPFTLGTARAGEVVGGDSVAGSAGLRALVKAGLIAREIKGSPGRCSTWRWMAGAANTGLHLPSWIAAALPHGYARAAADARLN
jgi:hypothetical protein